MASGKMNLAIVRSSVSVFKHLAASNRTVTQSGLNKRTVLTHTTESLEVCFRYGVIRALDLLSFDLAPLISTRCFPEELSY